MKVLDLFSGLGGWAKVFRERGHDVTTLDIDSRFGCDITKDILQVSVLDLTSTESWDAILASPPCECFSVASLGHHWTGGKRAYIPATDAAKNALLVIDHTVRLIKGLNPRFFIIENPRGVMRKLNCMQSLERHTVTYCRYGESRMKPTDLWGGFPPSLELKPMCKNGHPDHERAPRGAKTGTQGIKGAAERAIIPYLLARAVCEAMEKYILTNEAAILPTQQTDIQPFI